MGKVTDAVLFYTEESTQQISAIFKTRSLWTAWFGSLPVTQEKHYCISNISHSWLL